MQKMQEKLAEQAQHEALKTLLKQIVDCNANLTPMQKQFAKERIDQAALKADWVMEILRQCGFL